MDRLYKLLIVDDEVVIREGLRSYEWEELGVEVVGAASDGKHALDILKSQQVDIILSDIKMPFMDGIELSKEIRDNHPGCKVIFLSGYDDFTYAKAGMRHGVIDYILKPFDDEELKKVFEKVKGVLNDERKNEKKLDDYEKKLTEALPIAVKKFLYDIINQNTLMTQDELEDKCNYLEINLHGEYYACCILNTALEDKKGIITEVYQLVESYLQIHNMGYVTMDDNFNLILVFIFNLPIGIGNPYGHLASSIETIYEWIKTKLGKNKSPFICISAGNIYRSLFLLPLSFKQANKSLKRRYFNEQKTLFFSWEDKSTYNLIIEEYPYDKENDLLNAVIEGNVEGSREYLEIFLDSLSPSINHMEPQSIKKIMVQLLYMLDRRLEKHNTSLKELISLECSFEEVVESKENWNEMKSFIENCIVQIADSISQINMEVMPACFQAINKAKQFIEKHYSEKIMLNDVADHVYLNASYLSVQFKKETGKNFIEYLKEYRMEKAKELLKGTDIKIYEVGQKVGYDNNRYFSELFKEITGLTPIQYRKKKFV